MWCCVCYSVRHVCGEGELFPRFLFEPLQYRTFLIRIFFSLSFTRLREHTIPRWGQQNAAWRLWWYRRRVLHQRFAALVEQLHSKETKKKKEKEEECCTAFRPYNSNNKTGNPNIIICEAMRKVFDWSAAKWLLSSLNSISRLSI